jgi:hypothetical protein
MLNHTMSFHRGFPEIKVSGGHAWIETRAGGAETVTEVLIFVDRADLARLLVEAGAALHELQKAEFEVAR